VEPEQELAVESRPAVEAVRLLLPSPIGNLGLELRGTAISGIVISPDARARKEYRPLAKMKGSEQIDEIIGRLSEFFAGARRNLDLEYDLASSGVDPFARRVLRETVRIPYGKTRTYKDVAVAAGHPSAYRLVVSILLANPLPIVVPCHRVVPSKAGLGGYVGGEAKKRWLLRLERLNSASNF